MRKLISTCCFVATILICVTTAHAQDQETLRLKSGGPIEVKLLSWDFQTQTLKVELVDGATRELAADDLHSSDIKRIQRFFTKQMPGNRRTSSGSASSAGSSRSVGRSQNSSQSPPFNGFPNGSGSFSRAGGFATGRGGAGAFGSAGGFVMGGTGGNGAAARPTTSDSPGNPDSAGLADGENSSSSAFSGVININGQSMRFESPEEFDQAMKKLRGNHR